MSREITKQQRLFIEAYAGDEVAAMRIAGYTGADNYLKRKAEELLQRSEILEAIKRRDDLVDKNKKARLNREGLQDFWSSIVQNEDPHHVDEVDSMTNVPKPKGPLPLQARLKASELLGKSEGVFVDNVNLNANMTITELVSESLKSKRSLEDIEAEYEAIRKQNDTILLTDDALELPELDKSGSIEDLI